MRGSLTNINSFDNRLDSVYFGVRRVVVAAPADIKEVEIFSVGKHTSSNGTTLTFTADHLQQIADSYNPSIHEAPVIVGHAYATSPAYGWVESLKVAGDRLLARVKQIEPQFAELVRNGRFKKISAGLYVPDSPSNPHPGKFSLREISFLGAQPPAIKGLKPVEFGEEEGVLRFFSFGEENEPEPLSDYAGEGDTSRGDIKVPAHSKPNHKESINFMMGDRFTASVFQRLRDYLIDKEGLDAADKIIPADLMQMVVESANMPDYKSEMLDRLMMRVSELEAKVSPAQPIYKEQLMSVEPKDKEINFEERQRQLEIQQAELAKQAQKLAARQAELDKKEDLDFCESLIKTGKALPAEKDKLMAMFGSMRKSESTVDFGEGGEKEMLREFKQFLSDRPAVVAFGEFAPPDKAPPKSNSNFVVPEGYNVDAEALELHEKALAYQEAHPGVTYVQAIAKVGE